MTSLSHVKECLNKYKTFRAVISKQIEEIVKIRNQLSYVSSSMVQKSIGVGVKPSRLSFRLYERLSELSSIVLAHLAEQAENMKNMANLLGKVESDDIPVDVDFMNNLVSQIQQQYLLETTVAEKLVNEADNVSNIDPDSMTTFLACFEYPPYLTEADLDAFLTAC